jgi:heme-degrading monooxygenase HmoA
MSNNTGSPSAVARLWRGATTAESSDAYLAYLQETGIAEYRRTPGNRGVLVLRRVVEGRAELLLITLWESEDAVRRFAGDDIGRAVFYPEDDRFLIERGERVEHYEIVDAVPTAAAGLALHEG